MEKPERLQVKIAEAAHMLSLSTGSIRNLLHRGELSSVGTGGLRRIPVADLKSYMERNSS